MRRLSRPVVKRVLLVAASAAIIIATFVYFLPTIANYGEVWGVVKQLSWLQILALLGATAVNLVTFAPPWMVALPGLTFFQAFMVTQASTALSIVVPGGIAAGVAGSYGILRSWGFTSNGVASPCPGKVEGTQLYLSVKPQSVYEMQLRTSRHRSKKLQKNQWSLSLALPMR